MEGRLEKGKGADAKEIGDPHGEDFLREIHKCARTGNHQGLRALLNGQYVVGFIDTCTNGWTALRFACHGGHQECVKVLIECGAEVNSPTEAGATALHWACRFGSAKCVELLILAGASVDGTVGTYHSPLAEVCIHYRPKRSHSGLGYYRLANPNGFMNAREQEIMQEILARDAEEGIPLGHDYLQCARTLLRFGADVNHQPAGQQSCLERAIGNTPNGTKTLIKLLLENGASPHIDRVIGQVEPADEGAEKVGENQPRLPLIFQVIDGNKIRNKECFLYATWLMEYGADPNTTDNVSADYIGIYVCICAQW